jgi:hypothetical protein
LRATAAAAGVRRRFAPHQLRHAHAVELAHEGVPLMVIQRQLGHSNLGITSVYLQGIDNAEIIETVHARRAPMVPSAPRSSADAAPLLIAHCESDGVRASSCRYLTPAYVVPMHPCSPVEPHGVSAGRPERA